MQLRTTTMALLCLSATAFFTSCKKDDNNTPAGGNGNYQVPTTYNFTGMDSSRALTTLSMITDMETLITTGNTANTVVSATKLHSMFDNQGSPFTSTTFNNASVNANTSGIVLSSFPTSDGKTFLNNILDSINLSSQSTQPAANGVAGVSTKATLLSRNGFYWRQLFTKTMMGIVIGRSICDVYLGDSLNSNIDIKAKAHAWDQAFFMWDVPSNFPANRAGVKYWGSYTSQIDSGLAKPVQLTGVNANPTLLSAFLKGRAALANNDEVTAKQQAGVIISFFEEMEVAAALHELNEARGNITNGPQAVVGNLSESYGFLMALKFNTHRSKVTDQMISDIQAMYGTNLYNLDPTQISNIVDKYSAIYGWDSVKSYL